MVGLASHAVHVTAPPRIQQRATPAAMRGAVSEIPPCSTGFLHRSSSIVISCSQDLVRKFTNAFLHRDPRESLQDDCHEYCNISGAVSQSGRWSMTRLREHEITGVGGNHDGFFVLCEASRHGGNPLFALQCISRRSRRADAALPLSGPRADWLQRARPQGGHCRTFLQARRGQRDRRACRSPRRPRREPRQR